MNAVALDEVQPEEWPPKFTLDQEQVLSLFIGEGFYSSADASLREAVLNAIDAVGRRQTIEPDLEPRIVVTFDAADQTLTIDDNGDGMGPREVVDLFAKVGASASRMLAKGEAERYRSVGTFGIGVISYFLVCDEFELHTLRDGLDPVGLRFGRAMFAGSVPAEVIPPERNVTGTTIRMPLREPRLLELLVEKFPVWIRGVAGLVASLLPEARELAQGGLSRAIRPVSVEPPPWVEASHIGPPTQFSVWDSFDGRAKVDILYRGVHVSRLEINRYWGIEGSIHVDPRHFKPKLNREGFVGSELGAEVEAFLAAAHPAALIAALATLREDITSDETSAWSLNRWVAIWLAIPRTPGYEAVAAAWDAEFIQRPAFRLLGAGDSEVDVSVADLVALGAGEIFVAPQNPGSAHVVRQAVRALRARGEVVIRGIERDTGYLSQAPWIAATTAELLLGQFRDRLPPLREVASIADELVRQDSLIDIYDEPRVRVVNLGHDSVPLVAVGSELWLNVDDPRGRSILNELCDQNEGALGLWIACLLHSPDSAAELSRVVRAPARTPRIGPVLRQYLRTLTIQ